MFCTQCGNQISENSMFCPQCGAAVKRRAAAPVENRVTMGPPMANGAMTAQTMGNGAMAPQPMGYKAAAVAAPTEKKGINLLFRLLVSAALITVAVAAVLVYCYWPVLDVRIYPAEEMELLASVRTWDGSWLINEDGDGVVANCIANSSYSEGYLRVMERGRYGEKVKYGFADTDGEVVIPCKYDEAKDFHEGLAAVKTDGGWGYIDTEGNMVLKPRYSSAESFYEGMAMVSYTSDIFYIDTKGNEIARRDPGYYDDASGQFMQVPYESSDSPQNYREGSRFSEGMAAVRVRDGYGYIDESGEEVIECKYTYAGDFHDGYAAVMEESFDYPYYIDKNGERLDLWYMDGDTRQGIGMSRPVFSEANAITYGFSEGYAAISGYYSDRWAIGGFDGWGFVDTSGQLVIPLQYEETQNFHEGLAAVKLNGKWGFIDTAGNEVIPCKYDAVGDFSHGYAAVMKDKEGYYIDREDHIVCRIPQYKGQVMYLYPFRDVEDTFEPEEYLDPLKVNR